ncbi:DUF6325 family protein [Nesterenkonia sp. LB17]|uniref:DUF6325 family protein n=1 Tax=unclassified Nesterenkonia TaxID=2629769 RepID=UPI001F4D1525|nr:MULTISPECIES: DUF6325 family protein [unclassified Nesterenkonia]MCH8559721.1 DUF6325 family protein [Nesterenkonia sp. DZ6]MCH8561885.1 DUF6325 family protein [Nesterenkonia sp. YGD6]MCH8564578.1 DUF6325 family protein [Nesterenkonia sp. LB17]
MPDFRYGPVEIYLLAFEGQEPAPGALTALADVLSTGAVRLLDLVAVSKDEAGRAAMLDLAGRDRLGLSVGPDPVTEGLIGEEDLIELAAPLACGSSAVVLALELRFELMLADRLAQGEAEVLRTTRVPAPVVNALIDLYDPVEGGPP